MHIAYLVQRTNHETGETKVCVGASPISGKPYWEKLDQAAVAPLIIRDNAYANHVRQLCADKDDALSANHSYKLLTVTVAT